MREQGRSGSGRKERGGVRKERRDVGKERGVGEMRRLLGVRRRAREGERKQGVGERRKGVGEGRKHPPVHPSQWNVSLGHKTPRDICLPPFYKIGMKGQKPLSPPPPSLSPLRYTNKCQIDTT